MGWGVGGAEMALRMRMRMEEGEDRRGREGRSEPWVVTKKGTRVAPRGGTPNLTGWGHFPEEVTRNCVLKDQGQLAKGQGGTVPEGPGATQGASGRPR